MFSQDDFFLLLKFLNDNKNIIGSDSEDKSELVFDADTLTIDTSVAQTTVDNKIISQKFFENVLDQISFNTDDYNRLRRLFIDWNASMRSLISVARRTSNPFSLDKNLLETAIRSFGFNHSDILNSKQDRAILLLSLVNAYKSKGTPQTLNDMLAIFGLDNVAIYEWWLMPQDNIDVYFEGRKLDLGDNFSTFVNKRYMSWSTFQDIGDPHWTYTKEQILDLQNDPDQVIKLPSISPYFSIVAGTDLEEENKILAILARLLSDQYSNFLTTANQPPQDLLIDISGMVVSLTTLYLGILYSYWNYCDWLKYGKLIDYIAEEFQINPQTDYLPYIFEQPYAYEKLLFWCSIRVDSDGNHEPLDIFATGMPYGLYPLSGSPFVPYPIDMQFFVVYPSYQSVYSDDNLKFDFSKISFDGTVLYPDPNNWPSYPTDLQYLHDNTNILENYNSEIKNRPDLTDSIKQALEAYDLVVERPDDRDDAITKYQYFIEWYARNQNLNFTQNKMDPARILDGLSPVQTESNLPTGSLGDTILVRQGPGNLPTVYEKTSGGWQVLPNGLSIGNLGLNPQFKQWMDERVGTDYNEFLTLTRDLLKELDIFVATYIQRSQVELSDLLLGVLQIEKLVPIVNFFKPARARFLSFDLQHIFNNPLEDSIFADDDVELEITIELPEEGPLGLRQGNAENYDEYPWGHDFVDIYDSVSITVYEDDGLGNMILVPPSDWYPV